MDGSLMGVAMARGRGRRRVPVESEAHLLADLGPAVRQDPRREAPGRTQAGYGPDPDNPKRLVYRAQASPPHHRLLLDRRITVWQYEAAQKFAACWQLYEHGRTPDPDAPRAKRGPGPRSAEMSADRAAAGEKLREARAALGPMGEAVVVAVCVAELPLYRAYDHCFPLLQGRGGPSQPVKAALVQGMLVVALDVLARRWRLGPRRGRRGRGHVG